LSDKRFQVPIIKKIVLFFGSHEINTFIKTSFEESKKPKFSKSKKKLVAAIPSVQNPKKSIVSLSKNLVKVSSLRRKDKIMIYDLFHAQGLLIAVERFFKDFSRVFGSF
jgi:hypothetical protein